MKISFPEYLAKAIAILKADYGLEPCDIDEESVWTSYRIDSSVEEHVAHLAEKYDLKKIPDEVERIKASGVQINIPTTVDGFYKEMEKINRI